jgi:DnaJ-class molecular chaperone
MPTDDGMTPDDEYTGSIYDDTAWLCPECKGEGFTPLGEICPQCNGSGFAYDKEE